MSDKQYYTPDEILNITVQTGLAKASNPAWKQFILAVLAGAFVAFAASGSNMAAFGLLSDAHSYGIGKLIVGAVFPVALILILLAGAELFTGNNLIAAAVIHKKVPLCAMLKNWFFVYTGNFAGALLIVFFIIVSGQLSSGHNQLGGMTLKIAYAKVTMSFPQALVLGIMGNWLVCLAVWISYAAKDVTGKIFAAFFPIYLFAVSGFEHCIANVYYVPVGIAAKANAAYAAASGLNAGQLAVLTWGNFIYKNLIAATLGNIIGGTFFVACIYCVCYKCRLEKHS